MYKIPSDLHRWHEMGCDDPQLRLLEAELLRWILAAAAAAAIASDPTEGISGQVSAAAAAPRAVILSEQDGWWHWVDIIGRHNVKWHKEATRCHHRHRPTCDAVANAVTLSDGHGAAGWVTPLSVSRCRVDDNRPPPNVLRFEIHLERANADERFAAQRASDEGASQPRRKGNVHRRVSASRDLADVCSDRQ